MYVRIVKASEGSLDSIKIREEQCQSIYLDSVFKIVSYIYGTKNVIHVALHRLEIEKVILKNTFL